jgi:hypothetical protein
MPKSKEYAISKMMAHEFWKGASRPEAKRKREAVVFAPLPDRPEIEQALADHQWNRAARWLKNHTHDEDWPAPAGIHEKIEAQQAHLQDEMRAFGLRW